MKVPGAIRTVSKVAALSTGLLAVKNPGDLTILLYHRIGVGEREIDLPLAMYESQLEFVKAHYEAMSLDDALAEGLGRHRVVVTFDDGFRDFSDHAMRVLLELRIPAVLYLATGLIAEERRTRESDALSWGQLAEAVSTGLLTVGSHTHSHADMSSASEGEARDEMKKSRDLIEDKLGVECRHFAYPWSVASPAANRAARDLFDTAAIEWGTNRRPIHDLYRLGRLPVMRGDGPRFFRAKVRGWLDAEALIYRAARRGPWRSRIDARL